MISRRNALKTLAGSVAATSLLSPIDLLAKRHASGFKIGACDWSIGQRGKIEALALGKRIGLDGIQISLGTGPDNMHLLHKATRQAYQEAAKEHNMELG